MENFENIIDKFSKDEDIHVDDIPNLDLYMDQILTFFSDHLSEENNKELLTKAMINNYTKEKILSPVKGKKYTKEQIVQLLCIMNLKQTLTLSEIGVLLETENEEDVALAYTESLQLKNQLIPFVSKDLKAAIGKESVLENREEALKTVLTVSSLATFLKNIASEIVANLEQE